MMRVFIELRYVFKGIGMVSIKKLYLVFQI